MDVIVKLLGGYDSWQYVTVAFGLVIIGGGLTAWKLYFMPLFVTGQFMLMTLINNQVSTDKFSGAVGGLASTIPIIFTVFCILVDFTMIERQTFGKNKDEKDAKPQEKPTEKSDAFDTEQFKRKS